MNRETFEILVCESLDDPGRDGLRAAIDHATIHDPALEAVRDEWRRFETLLRRGLPEPCVDWTALSQAIVQSLDGPPSAGMDDEAIPLAAARRSGDAEIADESLDSAIAAQTSHGRVDWIRLHDRISAAVGAARPGLRTRPRLRLVAWSFLGVAAAAAALVMMFRPDWLVGTSLYPSERGAANAHVVAARESAGDSSAGEARSAQSQANATPTIAEAPAPSSAAVAAMVLSADRSATMAVASVSASIMESGDARAELERVTQTEAAATPDNEPKRFIMIDAADVDDATSVPTGA